MPEIEGVEVRVYTVPLEAPESDATLTWSATTVVVAQPRAGGEVGLGFTYATPAAGRLIEDLLLPAVRGLDAMDVPRCWEAMVRAIRNMGRPGISSMAIAALDIGLWDLKAKLLRVPLAELLGKARAQVPVYGSGGFTSLSDRELRQQLTSWSQKLGIPRVKIKVGEAWGTREARDLERTQLARKAVGDRVELYVDANGGYSAKQALRLAPAYQQLGVSWFEEPVSSDHLEQLATLRAQTQLEIAAGEYGYDLFYFERMCRAGAVDCLQADVSRCAGITEWLRVAGLAQSHGLEISGHCAPNLHLHPACAVSNLRHVEYFADHVRCDRVLFSGVQEPRAGFLAPDASRPGLGLELRPEAEERYRVPI
ncbi:MAG: enolase C-terminal domain-like protein [Candidatus Dormibacteria bacterium]